MKKMKLVAYKVLIITLLVISFSIITQIVNAAEVVVNMSQEYIDQVLQENEQRKTAYKTIPGITATAKEIKLFIESDFMYNGSKGLKSVPKETISAWLDTVSAATVGRRNF